MTPYFEAEGVTICNAPALDLLHSLADDSVDLIVCDWPYFKVKNDEAWDNQWATPAEFLAWMGEHLVEFRRVLRSNGSYYGFASPQMAARVEVLTGEWFEVLSNICWVKPDPDSEINKGAGRSGQVNKEQLRTYFPLQERIIFAEHYHADSTAKGEAGYGAKCDELRGFVFEPLRAYLDGERTRAELSRSDVGAIIAPPPHGEALTNHFFRPGQWALPTPENYAKLQEGFNRNQPGEYLRREYEDLRREYEDLRREYEDLRRPFNAHKDAPYTDVWTFPTVQAYNGKHICEKPYTMMQHIIEMSSRPGGVVLDPMCGSGNAILAARNLGRVAIGNDMDARWCGQAVRRLTRTIEGAMIPGDGEPLETLPLFRDA